MADNIRHIQRFQARQRQQLKKYDAIEAWLRAEHADNPDLPYWLMTISYGRHCCQAYLHWCDEALTTLRGLAGQAQTERSQRARRPNTQKANHIRRLTQRSRRRSC